MLERWLGQTAVDLNVLIANLRQRGSVRLFASTLRGEHGVATAVEISVVSVMNSERECFGFSIRTNNLKLSCSKLIVDIVGQAMLICGIAGYRNDSKFSLSRHLRDAHGAALMVNNDRIMKLNATMLMVHRES